MGRDVLSVADINADCKTKACLTLIKVFGYQDEISLVLRDPLGVLDPANNLLAGEDNSRQNRGADELGDWIEERYFLTLLSNIVTPYPCALICKIKDYEEYRYRCKFISMINTDKPESPTQLVVSKWYFEVPSSLI